MVLAFLGSLALLLIGAQDGTMRVGQPVFFGAHQAQVIPWTGMNFRSRPPDMFERIITAPGYGLPFASALYQQGYGHPFSHGMHPPFHGFQPVAEQANMGPAPESDASPLSFLRESFLKHSAVMRLERLLYWGLCLFSVLLAFTGVWCSLRPSQTRQSRKIQDEADWRSYLQQAYTHSEKNNARFLERLCFLEEQNKRLRKHTYSSVQAYEKTGTPSTSEKIQA